MDVVRRFSLLATASSLGIAALLGTVSRRPTMSRGAATTVAFESCRGDGAALFSLEGKEWRIEDCELTNVDCRELRLTDGVFERCDLTGADFTNAAVKATIKDCVLERVGGAGAFAGSTIDVPSWMSAAPALAKALGMTITA